MEKIIFYEKNYNNKTSIVAYCFSTEKPLQKFYFEEWKGMTEFIQKNKDKQLFFLCDENHFEYFNFDIQLSSSEIFSIKDLRNVVSSKINYIQNHLGSNNILLHHFIENYKLNGEKQQFILGKNGDISFTLSFIYLKKIFYNQLFSYFNSLIGTLKIWPQHYHTIKFLSNSIQKNDFSMIFLFEDYVQLLIIKNGVLFRSEKLNLGWTILKNIYKENNVLQFFYQSDQPHLFNDFSKNLVFQSIDFYSQLLTKRLANYVNMGENVFLVSDVIRNHHFVDRFGIAYSHLTSGYVVPFHYEKNLSLLGKKWQNDEIDILIFLNMSDK